MMQLNNSLTAIKVVNFLYQTKQSKIYSTNIAKKLNITYSHVVKIINKLEEKNIIKSHKHGRIKIVNLIDLKLGKYCEYLIEVFK